MIPINGQFITPAFLIIQIALIIAKLSGVDMSWHSALLPAYGALAFGVAFFSAWIYSLLRPIKEPDYKHRNSWVQCEYCLNKIMWNGGDKAPKGWEFSRYSTADCPRFICSKRKCKEAEAKHIEREDAALNEPAANIVHDDFGTWIKALQPLATVFGIEDSLDELSKNPEWQTAFDQGQCPADAMRDHLGTAYLSGYAPSLYLP
jgi:hypothetical protein